MSPERKATYVLIVGGGKVGWNLARELIAKKNTEVTLIESNRRKYLTIEQELEHQVQYGDASELWVLERAGISRADLVIAVTGDDEDNMLVCQVAKEKYLVDRVVAYVAGAVLGPEGRAMFGGPAPRTLDEAPRLELLDARVLGPDVRLEYRSACHGLGHS